MGLKLKLIEWWASKLLRRHIHGSDGTVYLSRYKVSGWMPGDSTLYPFSIYLHNIHREDEDKAPHDHPWAWAYSFILHGSYTEMRIVTRTNKQVLMHQVRKIRFFNFLTKDTYHVIESVSPEPVWTLFIVGPRVSSWGFFEDGRGHVEWRTRLRERGIPQPY